jgi:hypothetical protein
MQYYAIGLGIVIITTIIAISICACLCKSDICTNNKKEKIPLLNTNIYIEDGTEIIVSI